MEHAHSCETVAISSSSSGTTLGGEASGGSERVAFGGDEGAAGAIEKVALGGNGPAVRYLWWVCLLGHPLAVVLAVPWMAAHTVHARMRLRTAMPRLVL